MILSVLKFITYAFYVLIGVHTTDIFNSINIFILYQHKVRKKEKHQIIKLAK